MADNVLKGNAVIGQSGGPTSVINQSLVGVVEGLEKTDKIGKILGAHHAVEGVLNGDFIELQNIPQDRLNRLANTPSAGLGSSRVKPDKEYCHRMFESLARHDVRYFFYIGGNDSSDTCRIVNEVANDEGYELRCFHVPKTIDNDLMHNDHTPGFGTAAKFVACAFMGDDLDNRALRGIKINVVMGRHAGFLTASSLMARQHSEDGPHLIYVPEVSFEVEKFVQDVERVYAKYGRCLIAVSEGIHDSAGTPIVTKLAEQIEKDMHGNVQLSGTGALGDFLSKAIKDHMGPKTRVRSDTFGYLQRCFTGCVSVIDQREARAAGRKAAELALSGDIDGSIAIQRVSDHPYTVEFRRVDLSDVAGKTRTMPREYIVDNNNIDDSFRKYLSPIIGPLPQVELLRIRQG